MKISLCFMQSELAILAELGVAAESIHYDDLAVERRRILI